MHSSLRLLLGGLAAAAAFQASAQLRLYEHDRFTGRSVSVSNSERDLARHGFNDKASSAIGRGGNWVLCQDSQFRGRCVTLSPGRYPSLSAMRLNDRVSSARRVVHGRPR